MFLGSILFDARGESYAFTRDNASPYASEKPSLLTNSREKQEGSTRPAPHRNGGLLERGDQRSDLTLANLLLARGAPDCCAGKHIGLLENGRGASDSRVTYS
jgi:hypothetical protein